MIDQITMSGPSVVRVNDELTDHNPVGTKAALKYLEKVCPEEFKEVDISYDVICYMQKFKGNWKTVFKQFI